jgi:D-serine dehydratase
MQCQVGHPDDGRRAFYDSKVYFKMMNIQEILDTRVTSLTKGMPGHIEPLRLAQVASQRWNLLREDLPLPLLVLKRGSLLHNARAFADFMRQHGVSLAPHGKTTMCPQIFRIQLEHGAWGITAANVSQVQVYRRFGVARILLANQLVGRQNVRFVADELNRDPSFDFYCLVDSPELFDYLENELARCSLLRPLKVLVELGMQGGRSGFRHLADARELAQRIRRSRRMQLAGVESYEGLLGPSEKDLQRVRALLQDTVRLAESIEFDPSLDEVILSAGGSAFFDEVAEIFGRADLPARRIVIRSGCYITHDHNAYDHFRHRAFSGEGRWRDPLKPALEVWSYVQSLPEPGLAILGMGRRDAPDDWHGPTPLKRYRRDDWQDLAGCEITELNDQHAYLHYRDGIDLCVGDMICSGISHPCTAFDKWRCIPVVDEHYNVTDAYLTFF